MPTAKWVSISSDRTALCRDVSGLVWSFAARIGYELGRHSLVGKLEAREVREPQNLGQLDVIDFVSRVRRVVVIGMKTGEPPERRNVEQHEGKLIAAEENVERVVAVETIIQIQPHVFVLSDHGAVVVRAIGRANKVQPVRGIGGKLDPAPCPGAFGVLSGPHLQGGERAW